MPMSYSGTEQYSGNSDNIGPIRMGPTSIGLIVIYELCQSHTLRSGLDFRN